jgi:predicted Zn-dependent protease with MMP-like domain
MGSGQAAEAERLLDAADDAFEAEEHARAAGLARKAAKLARRAQDRELEADAAIVEAAALNALGDCGAALARADEALALAPDAVDALLERGHALHELCRFDDARAAVEDAVARAPDDAWGHHLLGLVAERRGDLAEAERRFARARRLAPDDYPRPATLSPAAFEAAVEAALEDLPPQVREVLANVPITVEDLPSDADLRESDPPLSPSILGLFRGAPHGRKHSDPWSALPSSIVLYQRNLERSARDRDELVREIAVTLVHEVGHFLGLDEDELWARGLE